MGRRHIILPNSLLPARQYIALLLLFFSCNAPSPKGALQLVQAVRISEPGNHVLHGLPLSIQLLGDSLAGIHFDATRYTIYNYYTGRIVSSLAPDSSILPDLLQQARVSYPRRYQLMSVREGREVGIPVLSVEGVFYSKEKQQYYLFISAVFAADTTIGVRGVIEPAVATHQLCYWATLNTDFTTTGKYTILRCASLAPAFLFGGLVQGERLLLPNVALAHIDTPGQGMLCSIDLWPEQGRVSNAPPPFDGRCRAQRKKHILEKVSLADIDGAAYYVSDGRRILYCKGNTFRNVYSMDSNRHVYSLYYNRTRNLLYIHTRFGEDAKGSAVFTLDTAGNSLCLIDSARDDRSVTMINDSLILSIHKTPDDEHYTFALYRY